MDENNGHKTQQLPATTLQLTITFDQLTGAINVTGAINNLFVTYGMLELAKDTVRDFIKANQSRIIPGVAVTNRVI